MDKEEIENKFGVFDDLADEEVSNEDSEAEIIDIPLKKDILLADEDFESLHEELRTSADKHTPSIDRTILNNNCKLETIVKEGLETSPFKIDINKKIEKPPKSYSFELDDFQKAAVLSVENNTSVLVAAHTSAGKTAVAEYVIAKCLANNQRVIYTSPIKALSNQKYRDLKNEFGSVGLITGDTTIDENQSCLVMTTEILRNMLFRSNEVAKETAWIIFDEVHYLKDRDRGVIWEETIILAPKNVRYCLLSATTPNASELAQWILKVKGLDCINVIYTDFRPTPLEYYAYKSGDKKILLVKDRYGKFNAPNFESISAHESSKAPKKKKNAPKAPEVINIVKMIKQKTWVPAIIFAFSKKEVEQLAKSIAMNMKMLNEKDVMTLVGIYKSSIARLSEEDQKLPQVVSLLDIIKSGVGLHHGGMLPVLKELVEILFQMGLLKVLVSTETFSMGVNMPAKCVVFSSVQKFDGEEFRVLSGSEFVQMSGRAGRRGKDKKGVVITMVDESTNMQQYGLMLNTESKNDPLISQFDISYNMLLNSFLLEGFEPEHMIEKSFKQFQSDVKKLYNEAFLTNWEEKMWLLRSELFDRNPKKFDMILRCIDADKRSKAIDKKLRKVLVQPEVILPWITIGRVLFVEGLGWVTVLNFSRVNGRINIDVVTPINFSKNKRIRKRITCSCFRCAMTNNITLLRDPKVISVDINYIKQVSQVVVKVPYNLETRDNLAQVIEVINKLATETHHVIPVLELIEHIKIPNRKTEKEVINLKKHQKEIKVNIYELYVEYKELLVSDIKAGENYRRLFIFDNTVGLEQQVNENLETSDIFYSKEALNELFIPSDGITVTDDDINRYMVEEVNSMKLFIKFSRKVKKLLVDDKSLKTTLILQQKIDGMRIVLKRLGFVDTEGVPTVKGRVASLIFGSDELLLTELIFMNQLTNLSARQLDVILSLFVNEEKKAAKSPPKLKDEKVTEVFESLKSTLGYLCTVYNDSGFDEIKEEEAIAELNTSLFDVVAKWYDGASFLDICKVTDMYEGSIIRGIKRLHELLTQLSECAKSIGNKELDEKFEEASKRLYRGIVFTASLYL